MENTDRELIMAVIKTNVELRRLYEQHHDLEDRLSSYEGRRFLTAEEELHQKRLKLEKLSGMDRIMQILRNHRTSPAAYEFQA